MISPDNLFFNPLKQYERIMSKNAVAIHEEKLISRGPMERNQDTLPISFLFQNNEQNTPGAASSGALWARTVFVEYFDFDFGEGFALIW